MPLGEALDDSDDYIISLLKKDAEQHSKRYNTVGNGPLLTAAKRRPDAPKPNTRFLRNIVKEADSHNAALKAKEEGEARARMDALRREKDVAGKRKRACEGDGAERDVKRRDMKESRPGRWANALGLGGASRGRTEREGQKQRDSQQKPQNDGAQDHDRERIARRHRHQDERDDEKRSRRKDRDRKSRRPERCHSRERDRSPRHRKEGRRRSRSRSRSPKQKPTKSNTADSPKDDPLTEFLRPLPSSQPLPRGRGALKPSQIDVRFQKDYDPTSDVHASHDPDEEDDWDMALDALKARTKWRTQGAERLRAAGFTEDEIQRWEKSRPSGAGEGNREGDIEDVRWRKQGEGREWDRGKIDNGEGGVSVKAEWAR